MALNTRSFCSLALLSSLPPQVVPESSVDNLATVCSVIFLSTPAPRPSAHTLWVAEEVKSPGRIPAKAHSRTAKHLPAWGKVTKAGVQLLCKPVLRPPSKSLPKLCIFKSLFQSKITKCYLASRISIQNSSDLCFPKHSKRWCSCLGLVLLLKASPQNYPEQR